RRRRCVDPDAGRTGRADRAGSTLTRPSCTDPGAQVTMRRLVRTLAIVLAVGGASFALYASRFLVLAIQQEDRPALAIAALRIKWGATVVQVDDDVILADAAMDRLDGSWPLRKHLQAQGLVLVDQLGAML